MVYEGKILDGRNRHAACQIAGFSIDIKTDPEVANDVKAGRISLNEGAKRAGVAKKTKAAKRVFQPERPDSSEEPDTKAKCASTYGADAKEVPVVDDATSKEEKLQASFWNWVESHEPGNLLAIKVALQQALPRWT